MRKALIVGVDYYREIGKLYGCVNDAHSVNSVLERHDGGAINFECKLLTSSSEEDSLDKGVLKDHIEQLFNDDSSVALFYFSGHGYIDANGGYILTSEASRGDDGVSLSEILNYANNSPAKNKLIILDSCYSGIAGNTMSQKISSLNEGVTVLTSSTKDQYSIEQNGRGLYTWLLVDALRGSAANLLGEVSPGSVYAHIDKSLSAWEQRPVFKTNVKQFISLREVTPPIAREDLRKIIKFFPVEGFEFNLDPTFEQEMRGRDVEMPNPNKNNVEIFSVLQKYNRLNLLIPVGADHMWHAAMESKSCRLTALGEHYRRLVEKGII